MNSALRNFFEESSASQEVRTALAENRTLQGEFSGVRCDAKPTAAHLADLETFVDRAERGDDELAIEVHDRACEIVTRNDTIKSRLLALAALLSGYDPRWRAQ